MSEIKSTMDLVMEKAGKLEITPEEREKFKKDEVKRLAQHLFNRYFLEEERKDLNALKKELDGQREGVKEALTELVISAYSVEESAVTLLNGLEILLGRRGKETVEALRELTTRYQKEREQGYQELEKELREELARKGISGPAVEPNLDANPRWTDFIDKLKGKYKGHLQGIFVDL
ncbi:MAG: hypothetical protein JSW32_05145 [Deltaproteobacteria bacterium]|nr:MAG: hypothetical protein JSW32_05145 [Deltaproteobacteria bacterium]